MSHFKTVRLCENSEVCLGNHDNGNKSNVGYINSDCVYVFDSGYSPIFFNEYITRFSSFGKKIIIVLSHHHSDHINGIWGLEDNSNVSIICSFSTARKLKTNIKNITVCKEDVCLNGHIYVKRCVNCHTSEDLILEDVNNGIVFMGDMMMDCHHPYIKNKNVKQWIKCLEMLKNKNYDYYIPGHGEGMSRSVIEHYINYLTLLMEYVKNDDLEKIYNERIESFLNQSKSFNWKQKENVRRNFELLQE